MNEIVINNTALPVMCGCDYLTASEPFFHTDRTADFNVMLYVTQGVIYVTEDETDYDIHEGELLFLKSGVHHYGKSQIPKGTCWHYFHFFCNENDKYDFFDPSVSEHELFSPLSFSAKLPKKLSELSGSELEKKIISAVEYCHGDERMKEWNANRILFELLTDIAMYEITEKNAPLLSDKICAWLAEHYAEPFSSANLEREFYLSYKRMAFLFKRDKGLTMQQYHNDVKMKAACKLLRSTLLSIGEISERTGFSDMFYFSRCFRKYSGMSPMEYRRNAQKIY